jgi:hypothetical protein
MAFRLPHDDREPNPEAAKLSPDNAQLELWRAQLQRDHNLISDKEMTKVEGSAMLATRSRVLWNPFTGEFRTVEISDKYKSGDYLKIEGDKLTRLIKGD